MVFVTYKGRSSDSYRFSCSDIDDPAISELKLLIRNQNKYLNKFNKAIGYKKYSTKGLRIRPRGPRLSTYAHDTPIENATHFDVYTRDYC